MYQHLNYQTTCCTFKKSKISGQFRHFENFEIEKSNQETAIDQSSFIDHDKGTISVVKCDMVYGNGDLCSYCKKKKREAKRKGCWKKNILEVYNYRDFDLCDNDLRFNSHDYIILKEDEF